MYSIPSFESSSLDSRCAFICEVSGSAEVCIQQHRCSVAGKIGGNTGESVPEPMHWPEMQRCDTSGVWDGPNHESLHTAIIVHYARFFKTRLPVGLP